MIVATADAADVATLAKVHAAAFPVSWSAAEFEALFATPGVFARAVEEAGQMVAFILARVVADEGEILTIAVASPRRGKGLGGKLVDAFRSAAVERGAQRLFLEVASDNQPALSLYRKTGFVVVGRRAGYYGDGVADALVLRLELNT